MSARPLPLILLGAGGHARVVLSLLRAAKREVIGVCDPQLTQAGEKRWRDLEVLGGDAVLETVDPRTVAIALGIGQLVTGTLRRDLFENIVRAGFACPALQHPHAWVDQSASLADGVQIMAGAVIQPDAHIGRNTIVNTAASVDHDCRIGAHVHVAPGATLCGDVHVGDGAFIGSGATVIQGIHIGAHAVVGAGTVVTRDLPAHGRVLGAAVRRFEV